MGSISAWVLYQHGFYISMGSILARMVYIISMGSISAWVLYGSMGSGHGFYISMGSISAWVLY